MMEHVSEFLQIVFSALITAATPVLVAYVVAWLKARQREIEADLSEQERYLIREALRVAVHAAEQSGLAAGLVKEGEKKKQWAAEVAQQYLARYGLDLDLNELTGLIEATVWEEINRYRPDKPKPDEPDESDEPVYALPLV